MGKLANAEERQKDRTSLVPGGLNLRPSRQVSQNLTALLAGGSLPAFLYLFQDLLLDCLFHKKVNLHSASTLFLMNPLCHSALQATPFLVTCELQQGVGLPR